VAHQSLNFEIAKFIQTPNHMTLVEVWWWRTCFRTTSPHHLPTLLARKREPGVGFSFTTNYQLATTTTPTLLARKHEPGVGISLTQCVVGGDDEIGPKRRFGPLVRFSFFFPCFFFCTDWCFSVLFVFWQHDEGLGGRRRRERAKTTQNALLGP
jgi:hypothetical protein